MHNTHSTIYPYANPYNPYFAVRVSHLWFVRLRRFHEQSTVELGTQGYVSTHVHGDEENGAVISALPSEGPWIVRMGRVEYAGAFYSLQYVLVVMRDQDIAYDL